MGIWTGGELTHSRRQESLRSVWSMEGYTTIGKTNHIQHYILESMCPTGRTLNRPHHHSLSTLPLPVSSLLPTWLPGSHYAPGTVQTLSSHAVLQESPRWTRSISLCFSLVYPGDTAVVKQGPIFRHQRREIFTVGRTTHSISVTAGKFKTACEMTSNSRYLTYLDLF